MRRTVIVAVLIVGVLFVLLGIQSAPPRPGAHGPSPAPSRTAASPELAPARPRRATLPKPTVPRADRRRVVNATPPAPAAEGPVDKRADATEGDATVERIREGMESVTEDIAGCIDEWSAADATIRGRVLVGFRLDAAGLQEAWIVDHENVPTGPLSCFASAVWEVDWEGVSDRELEVTFPFVVESGAAPPQ